ncbi:MAG TPA: hypothetical protein VIH88_01960 [Candidatus Acidoferrales bacterium]
MKKTQVALAALALLVATLLTSSAARADGWSVGAVVTYDQSDWGDQTNVAGMLMDDNFDAIYASTGGVFVIGSTTPGNFMVFNGAANLLDYLPTSGLPGALDADLVNPTTSSSGLFGGEAAALKLNLDFSNAGLLPNSSGLLLGDLVLTGFSGSESSLDGLTVEQFFPLSQAALGGQATSIGLADIDNITANINDAFDVGQPDSFAQEHLIAPGSSTAMPEPPTLLLAAVGVLAAAMFRKKRVLGHPNPI